MEFFKKLKDRREEKKRLASAYAAGQDFGKALFEKASRFSDRRLDQITFNLLAVFKDRLKVVYENPEYRPEIVAAAELEIFKEQIVKAQETMWFELQQHLSTEVEVAETIGMTKELSDVIENLVQKQITSLVAACKVLYESKLEEIASGAKT
jgi:hypothetical protein